MKIKRIEYNWFYTTEDGVAYNVAELNKPYLDLDGVHNYVEYPLVIAIDYIDGYSTPCYQITLSDGQLKRIFNPNTVLYV